MTNRKGSHRRFKLGDVVVCSLRCEDYHRFKGTKVVEDDGKHVVCVVVTSEFLQFSKSRGNDLTTPRPEYGFPGLQPGDQWCLCALRWKEAFKAGFAPKVVLEATDESALEYVDINDLILHAVKSHA